MNDEMQTNGTRRAAVAFNRIADRVDLAIDLLTLGQYGLERIPGGCERTAGREQRAAPSRRRGDCAPAAAIAWDWPAARGEHAAR